MYFSRIISQARFCICRGVSFCRFHFTCGSRSFVFPQMQVEKSERAAFGIGDHWEPDFIDYLFIAMMQSATFGPTDSPVLARWAKGLTMAQVLISLTLVVLLISHAVGAI